VILIVGASLLSRSFVRLLPVDLGYTVKHVLNATVELPSDAPDTRIDRLIEGALGRPRAMPGVTSAGAAAMISCGRQP
jgi:hypothetical protein